MSPRQAPLLAVLVVVGAVAVGLPAVTAQETTTEALTTQNNAAGGMGTQLTAFLQSNSAAANDTVESGMWQSAYNRSNGTERVELVTDRTGSLEQRLGRLQERNAALEQRYENGSLSEQAYVAQRSRLVTETERLRTAINDTDTAAEQTGVDDTALERLKQNASELSGRQVSSIARGIVAPPDVAGPGEQGPPDGIGANRSERESPDGENAGGSNDAAEGAGNGPEQNTERTNGSKQDGSTTDDDTDPGSDEADDSAGQSGTDGDTGAGDSSGGEDQGDNGKQEGSDKNSDNGNGQRNDTGGS